MPIDEIPHHEWASFCETFSRQHQGWMIDVEASEAPGWHPSNTDPGLEAEIRAYDQVGQAAIESEAATATLQVRGLIPDVVLKSVAVTRSPAGEEQIVIAAESRVGKSLTHAVQLPIRLRLEHTENGADEALYIDTDNHTVAIRFPVTAPMEALDGFISE